MNTRKTTVALDFLGCKLNQAEMEELGGELTQAGYTIVPADEKADIYVLNTCTVTHVADRKSRQLLRQARRCNPDARLIAIGCYVERDAKALQKLDGVELVLGNDRKHDLVRLMGPSPPDAGSAGTLFTPVRTRSFLKIQDGCRNACAYCIVPLVRSRVGNVLADEVVERVRQLETQGRREVVLTGTEIGTYRDGDNGLKELLERILDETGIERVRVSSLQPPEITEKLIHLWRNHRLCPHFHLSLQSGSESVLRRMKRRYDIIRYRETIDMIRGLLPDAAVTTDIIVGFPGETEEEFEESLRTCRELAFTRIHVFSYSPRPGTAAATMPDQVPESVKKERSRRMQDLADKSAKQFREIYLGRTMNVLFEQQSGNYWTGHTGNYIKVYVKSDRDFGNQIAPVRLEKLYRDGLFGQIDYHAIPVY